MERASAQTRTLSSHSWRSETAAVVDLSSLYWNSLPLKNIHGQKRLSGSGDPATSLTNTACSTPCISNAASWTPRTFIIGTYDENTHVRAHTHTSTNILLIRAPISLWLTAAFLHLFSNTMQQQLLLQEFNTLDPQSWNISYHKRGQFFTDSKHFSSCHQLLIQ